MPKLVSGQVPARLNDNDISRSGSSPYITRVYNCATMDNMMRGAFKRRALERAKRRGQEQRGMELANEISTAEARKVPDLEKRATRDGLTGLENITEFERRMGKEFDSFNRVKEKLANARLGGKERFRKGDKSMRAIAIAIFDIDNFKEINGDPRYGHLAGNKVLEKVSEVLRHEEREADSVARFGGDEFAIGCRGTTQKQAFKKVERIRKAIQNLSVEWEGQQISITMTFGISSTENATTFDLAMQQADQALLAAKKAGKNRTICYADIAEKAQASSEDI